MLQPEGGHIDIHCGVCFLSLRIFSATDVKYLLKVFDNSVGLVIL